jgi:hypothetical protein
MVPAELPVRFTEQDPLFPPPDSVQLVLVGETPAPDAATLTDPVGVVAPGAGSATVIEQLLATPVLTGLVQLTDVVLARFTRMDASAPLDVEAL